MTGLSGTRGKSLGIIQELLFITGPSFNNGNRSLGEGIGMEECRSY